MKKFAAGVLLEDASVVGPSFDDSVRSTEWRSKLGGCAFPMMLVAEKDEIAGHKCELTTVLIVPAGVFGLAVVNSCLG